MKNSFASILGGIVLLAIVSVGDAKALVFPASSCSAPGFQPGTPSNPSFVCNLFPSDGAGNFAPVSNASFPAANVNKETSGYLVLLKNGTVGNIDPATGVDPNQSDWLQVLQFVDNPNPPGPGVANALTLYTIGCTGGFGANDRTCFPSVLTVQNSGSVFSDQFGAGSTTYQYDAQLNGKYIYNVNFGTPEPGTLSLLGGGLAALALIRRRRSAASSR